MLSRSLFSLGIAVFVSLLELSNAEYKSPYHLVDFYKPKDFFKKFIFFTGADPTAGFVQYVNHTYAKENGLIKTHNDSVTIGVDNVNYYDPWGPGRPSVRLESHKRYTHGLFVLNLNQMPHACGAWPAFWTYGPNWPANGEIDIIEGVNTNHNNLISLHTSKDCTIAGSGQSGKLITNACNLGDSHTGCGVMAHDKHNNTFGRGFNRAGGGVYAMEWTSSFIRTWHWPHHKVPESLRKGEPNTSKFGVPIANFQGSCDINQHFRDHAIVFDITFCGGYAGGIYSQSECPNAAQGYRGCMNFVGNNPDHYNDVKWDIRHLKVYQLKGGETSYLSALPPNPISSVVPYASTARPKHLSTIIVPGGGHTGHVSSHTLSVASTHKSNKPATKTTSHKSSKTSHKTSHSATTTKSSETSHSGSSTGSTSASGSASSTGSVSSGHTTVSSGSSSITTVASVHTTLIPHKTTSSHHKASSHKASKTTAKHKSSTAKPGKHSEHHSSESKTASQTSSTRKHVLPSFLTKKILHKPTAKSTAKHN